MTKTLTLDRDSENDLIFDSITGQYVSATPITYPPFPLYAWTTASPSTSEEADLPTTFYTDTTQPTINSTIYDSNGNDITSQVLWGSSYFSEVTVEHIIWSKPGPI